MNQTRREILGSIKSVPGNALESYGKPWEYPGVFREISQYSQLATRFGRIVLGKAAAIGQPIDSQAAIRTLSRKSQDFSRYVLGLLAASPTTFDGGNRSVNSHNCKFGVFVQIPDLQLWHFAVYATQYGFAFVFTGGGKFSRLDSGDNDILFRITDVAASGFHPFGGMFFRQS